MKYSIVAINAICLLATATMAAPIDQAAKYLSLPLRVETKKEFLQSRYSSPFMKRDAIEEVEAVELYEYVVAMDFGTPKQHERLLLDTGSSDMWVYSSNTPAKFAYDVAASSTSHRNNRQVKMTYGYDTVEGEWVTDDVSFGHADHPFTVKNQSFALVNQFQPEVSEIGIMGVGLAEGVSSDTPYINFPQNLVNQGIIKRRVYCVYVDNLENGGGRAFFGAVDKAKYKGNLYTVNSTRNDRFYIDINQVKVNGTLKSTVFPYTFDVAVDTGSSLTFLPWRFVEAIASAFGATWEKGVNAFTTSETPVGSATFDFNGAEITLDASQLFFKNKLSNGKYALAIFPSAINNFNNVLGVNFLRSAYLVFDVDRKQISIAQPSFDSKKSEIYAVADDIPGALPAPGSSRQDDSYN